MRQLILLSLGTLLCTASFSQSGEQEYEGKYLGWVKMADPKVVQKPYTVDHRKYSAKQMSISLLISSWLQQSYTPKGAIGNAYKLVNETLVPYNQQTKAVPQMYGTTSKTFIELKKNAQGKWMPYTNTNWFADIAVNGKIGAISAGITTPDQYYFYIPGETGLNDDERKIANLRGFTTHPNLKKYFSWFQPKGIGTTLQYVVLLCKDNVKPYVQVTKGSGNFENKNFPTNYPVYKFDPAKLALSKSDSPQWIVISWDAEGVANGNEPGTHLHESMMNNIDYDYIYNYFFYPEKVKGIAYKPLRSPTLEEKIVVTEKSDNTKKMEAEPSVFFYEDFSTTTTGQKPIGWTSAMNLDAQYTTVNTLPGLDGKWLEIKGQTGLTPLNLKKPLPQDFELSFDLAVPKDIPWGAKAFELQLGTKNNTQSNSPSLELRIRAGYWGRPGETTLNGNFGTGYMAGGKPYYDATGFSNDKEINLVKVILRKKGESLAYYINQNKIVEFPKAFPSTTLFNLLQLKHHSSNGNTEKYYISNIKITKE